MGNFISFRTEWRKSGGERPRGTRSSPARCLSLSLLLVQAVKLWLTALLVPPLSGMALLWDATVGAALLPTPRQGEAVVPVCRGSLLQRHICDCQHHILSSSQFNPQHQTLPKQDPPPTRCREEGVEQKGGSRVSGVKLKSA